MNNETTTMHKETITHDVRGSPPSHGYMHQLFFSFIVFCQYSTSTEPQYHTPHRTGDLRTLR
jgi:hypothetical protein